MTGGKTPQKLTFFSDGTLVGAGAQHNAYRANFVIPRNSDTSIPYNYIALSGEFPTNDRGLLSITRINDQNMFYFYDADNQRTVRANPQNKREFMIYGSEGLLAEYDDTQQPQVEYIRLGGKVIAQRGKATANGCTKWLFCDSFEDSSGMLGGATSGNVTYLHNDILGTPVAATDKSGNIKWRSYRMAFGMVENSQSEPVRTKFPIGYTGHEFDAETGLTYAQARYYRRDSGAFISPDTLTFRESDLTSVNRYSYGANNPYKYIDPTGKVIETAWDAANVALGTVSLYDNLDNGNYWSASLDLVGLAYDGVAIAVPFLPAGASTGIKAARYSDEAVDAVNLTSSNTRNASKIKAINLLSWKKVDIDMDEVISGHTKYGRRVMKESRKDLFPEHMTEKQIEKAIRDAYRYGKKIKTQDARVLVSGPFEKSGKIEMWVNTRTKEIETAYPKLN